MNYSNIKNVLNTFVDFFVFFFIFLQGKILRKYSSTYLPHSIALTSLKSSLIFSTSKMSVVEINILIRNPTDYLLGIQF